MKRMISAALALAFVVALPLAAADPKDEKQAKHQCRVEYNEAKKEARKAKTHKERVQGVHAAKKRYEECLERAKKS